MITGHSGPLPQAAPTKPHLGRAALILLPCLGVGLIWALVILPLLALSALVGAVLIASGAVLGWLGGVLTWAGPLPATGLNRLGTWVNELTRRMVTWTSPAPCTCRLDLGAIGRGCPQHDPRGVAGVHRHPYQRPADPVPDPAPSISVEEVIIVQPPRTNHQGN